MAGAVSCPISLVCSVSFFWYVNPDVRLPFSDWTPSEEVWPRWHQILEAKRTRIGAASSLDRPNRGTQSGHLGYLNLEHQIVLAVCFCLLCL